MAVPQDLAVGGPLHQERPGCLVRRPAGVVWAAQELWRRPEAAGWRLLAPATAGRSGRLGGRGGPPATLLAPCVAVAVEAVWAGASPVQAPLVPRLAPVHEAERWRDGGPGALPRVVSERRAIGAAPRGVASALCEGVETRLPMGLSVWRDPCAGHRKGPQRSGGTQEGPTPRVAGSAAHHP